MSDIYPAMRRAEFYLRVERVMIESAALRLGGSPSVRPWWIMRDGDEWKVIGDTPERTVDRRLMLKNWEADAFAFADECLDAERDAEDCASCLTWAILSDETTADHGAADRG